ncbi:M17 family metallopeptidase [Mycoplasma corogypsi]|uniref:M17 family metallopeptidase n=1 Tax=Mycoplasma corogypsi TaxID=2106 RepID=UPI0038739AC9
MIQITFNKTDNFLLKAAYENTDFPNFVAKKHGKITHDFTNNVAYLYIEAKKANYDELQNIALNFFANLEHNYCVDAESFVTNNLDIYNVAQLLILKAYFATAKLFKKTNEAKDDKEFNIDIYFATQSTQLEKHIEKLKLLATNINKARDFQIMPENFLNSEMLAAQVAEDLSAIPNLQVKTLTKHEIQALGMNLLLSVNKGSTHEPRVLVATYNGNPDSNEHISFVGKGITFDTGGVNTKGYHMDGMKFDMSGSVIVAYAVKTLAQLKAKVNVSAVMCITDNRINNDASLPQNIYQSMSGKWVEVADTDAEGRLVLADGLTYAATKLNATTLVDVATLTGAILAALGNTYTGVWSTNDKKWDTFNQSAIKTREKIWRMPMHEDYNKGNKSSKVADLLNWSKTVRPDFSQAAMFLKEFTNNVDYIHCDVAGTADVSGEPQGVLIPTLVEFALESFK